MFPSRFVRAAKRALERGGKQTKTRVRVADDRRDATRDRTKIVVRDLRELLGPLRDARRRAEDKLEELRDQHPVPFQRVERIFKPKK